MGRHRFLKYFFCLNVFLLLFLYSSVLLKIRALLLLGYWETLHFSVPKVCCINISAVINTFKN